MKNKLLKRFVAIAFSLVFIVSAVGFTNSYVNPDGISDPVNARTYYQGTHVFNTTETDIDFVVNGKTDYVLVYPKNASTYENTAKNEFITLFKEATGIKITAITDEGLSYNANSKYISIGNTTLLAGSGLTVDKDLVTESGVRILSKDNTVFLSGGDKDGVIYSVYDFMEIMFNYDCFYVDCIIIDKVENIKMKAFDVTDIPDFKLRVNGYGMFSPSNGAEYVTMANRMRVNYRRNNYFPIHDRYDSATAPSKTSHNTNTILPYETYGEEHDEWFAKDKQGLQLCYTARGNETEYKLMVTETVKKCLNSLQFYLEKDYPLYNTFGIMIEDNGENCMCEHCAAAAEKYGATSGAIVVFLNNVAREFTQTYSKLKAENPDDEQYSRDVEDFRFIMFAYLFSVGAPAKYNQTTQEWEPTCPEVVTDDNVLVQLAVTNLYSWYSVLDSTNKGGKDTIDGWGAVSDNIYYWVYTGNFHNQMYPYVDLNFINAETYSYLASKSDDSMYDQSFWNARGGMSAWLNMKMYVDMKLQWNTSLDVVELQNKWFKAMFKYDETISIMQNLYEEISTYMRTVALDTGVEKNFMGIHLYNYVDFFKYQTVLKWLNTMDKAIDSLAMYEGDEDYEAVRKHIELEALSPMYILLDLHGGAMSNNFKRELKSRLEYDLDYLGLHNMIINESSYKLTTWLSKIEV